jgi:outer membrane protein OmpA-like peptidoglycan-associated protein
VAAYLKSHEVTAVRVSTFGAGSSYPVASNATPEGRALNRRVEIALLPITG